ncbi:hypothetical protein RHMOL_Rhmol02G0123900 [Rhododendron molle]|uniref:Uncharacterized protein n=1 Tax=Rhododendron molle TaxID=49168 RepID=A0ACC0PPQ8_RHOML|nr:hypothetical protein RHMOL_Rhmol02G0123900 [Rhododendron molle]
MASSSSSSSSSIPPNLNLLVSNLTSFVIVKLDSSNYIIWQCQFQNILRANGLIGYVDGSIKCPPLKVTDANGKEVLNESAQIWSQLGTITMEQVSALLCSEAIHIESKVKQPSSDLNVAYTVARGGFSPGFSTRGGGFSNTSRGRGFGSNNNNNRGGRFSPSPGCGSFRGGAHSSFGGPHPPFGSPSSSFGGGFRGPIICQICNKLNHSALECRYCLNTGFYPSTSSYSPRAFVASSTSPGCSWVPSGLPTGLPNWYLDSAATNHVTNDAQNLDYYQPYSGFDQVTVGNGASLPIQHTGKGLLPTPNYSFQLNKVLHIPSMATNLLSINQLTKDNQCTVTFDSDSLVIQDKVTRQVLHRGANVNGLYQFVSSSPQAFINTTPVVSSSTSFTQQWHQLLGHPSSIKFQHILNKLQIP